MLLGSWGRKRQFVELCKLITSATSVQMQNSEFAPGAAGDPSENLRRYRAGRGGSRSAREPEEQARPAILRPRSVGRSAERPNIPACDSSGFRLESTATQVHAEPQ